MNSVNMSIYEKNDRSNEVNRNKIYATIINFLKRFWEWKLNTAFIYGQLYENIKYNSGKIHRDNT